MVNRFTSSILPDLPEEIWYEVWRHLSGETLVTCMTVCSWWRRQIQRRIILNSCHGHYFICKRLKYTPGNDALDHRKSVRNCLRFAVSKSIKFHGIWSYTGNDKEILDLSVPVVFERITTQFSIFHEEQLLDQKVSIMNIAEARKKVKLKDHVPHIETILLTTPIRLEKNIWYDLELIIYPTDVTNHYSGYPITLCGAEVWTCYGNNGKENIKIQEVEFRFMDSIRGGRSSVTEGQIPAILFSPTELH